ncbi:hypothetical protein DM02DRAFT_618577 [Periconia macrospinosa]|uniref:Uncharacterized protein n=1 Tax=Periconia macrospinosa TaxID=97972 RepID=A0A2V1D8X2_9PLEO|nr:hypothetical protein DM02DRAFT_618577 [Periconia macrospinosa]
MASVRRMDAYEIGRIYGVVAVIILTILVAFISVWLGRKIRKHYNAKEYVEEIPRANDVELSNMNCTHCVHPGYRV